MPIIMLRTIIFLVVMYYLQMNYYSTSIAILFFYWLKAWICDLLGVEF